ncbi:thiamine transporter 2 [Nilaparvata lugens]|uniref:thiamine transporter 2 n=1 Tax=Nilaparvata lugens TaxID=108931 RepID=UPI00193E9EDC|nr:thiamine transporter 2 [Nilaparvata lugens]XP_039295513.1 thiamine transporter 2 [Nilaparvata lugens]
MEKWLRVSLLLSIFGVLKEFRPTEPFITEFLTNPPLNFTKETVTYEIYPIGVYSNMLELIIVFLVTDYFRYQPVIVTCAISGLIVYLILTFGKSLIWMQSTQIFYGLFLAGDIAYYSYIYAKVDKEHFQEVTSHTRSAYLIGRTISGVTSQVCVTFNLLTYYQMNFLTIGGLSLAVLWSLSLPKVEHSFYFHRKEKEEAEVEDNPTIIGHSSSSIIGRDDVTTDANRFSDVIKTMGNDIKYTLSSQKIIFPLIWSVVATSCYYQVLSFVQLLWHHIAKSNSEDQDLWNGAVETTYTLLGAVGTLSASKIRLNWEKYGNLICGISIFAMAVMLFLMSQTRILWIAYATLITFNIIYQVTITFVK